MNHTKCKKNSIATRSYYILFYCLPFIFPLESRNRRSAHFPEYMIKVVHEHCEIADLDIVSELRLRSHLVEQTIFDDLS